MREGAPALEWLDWWSSSYRLMAETLNNSISLAPRNLTQAILPGWLFANTINVTEENSNSPETERRILESRSYGQQLGKILDAVNELIKERPPGAQDVPAFQELSRLWSDIDDIKSQPAARQARRAERAIRDLAELKQKDAAEYERLASQFRAVIDGRPPAA